MSFLDQFFQHSESLADVATNTSSSVHLASVPKRSLALMHSPMKVIFLAPFVGEKQCQKSGESWFSLRTKLNPCSFVAYSSYSYIYIYISTRVGLKTEVFAMPKLDEFLDEVVKAGCPVRH